MWVLNRTFVCYRDIGFFVFSLFSHFNWIWKIFYIVSTLAESQEPEEKDFISTNSSCINLQLSLWNNGGCPISHFSIEHRPHGQSFCYFRLIVCSIFIILCLYLKKKTLHISFIFNLPNDNYYYYYYYCHENAHVDIKCTFSTVEKFEVFKMATGLMSI